MLHSIPILLLASACLVAGQLPGPHQPEINPPISWQQCDKAGHCTTQHGGLTMESEWRPTHDGHGKDCYDANGKPVPTICHDDVTCAKACVIEGVNYTQHGVETNGGTLRMMLDNFPEGKFQTNVPFRLFVLKNDSTQYEIFHLLGQEFTFDVDLSTMPCGTNAALFMITMDKDPTVRFPNNKVGAKYGTGYCDAQCFQGRKFMPAGSGICCAEMDIWEANSQAAAYTIHPCQTAPFRLCGPTTGDACMTPTNRFGGTCDPSGCSYNSYREGAHDFYGPGKTVDTKKVFSIVTQFITSDGTPQGNLIEVRRHYVQNGKVIPNSHTKVSGITETNSITDKFCTETKANLHGGIKAMGEALRTGMVLAFQVWDSPDDHMEWLDHGSAGPCSATSGDPKVIEKTDAHAYFTISNMKWGPINSTFPHSA